MRLGDIANEDAAGFGKPLEGVRILALEQMQSLPFATQLLARLGADVVKVEHPTAGDQGRGALPAMEDPEGRRVGATFLRNNLNKRSVGIDLKHPEGRRLVHELAPKFDVVAENSKAGAMDRLGLGYSDIAAVHPEVIYLSISGFGTTPGPYAGWPAFAPIVEAMSGIYEYKRQGDDPPSVAPVGALGDIGTALFATIGILAGIRHRERTGQGQHLDVAMLDSLVSLTDIVTNYWSMGLKGGAGAPMILHGFRASDGWFIVQAGREHHFHKLVEVIGHPEWVDDPRFTTREGWIEHLESDLRPAIEGWAASRTKLEASAELGAAGIAAGPCFSDEDIVHDPHVATRNMLVECPRTDGVDQPVLVPGNPIKMSKVAEGPEQRVPWLGEHTDDVLGAELGIDVDTLSRLRGDGAIG